MKALGIPHSRQADRKSTRVLLALGWYASAIHQGVAHYARAARWSLDINYCRTIAYPKKWKGDGIIAILGSNPSVDAMVKASCLPTVCIGPKITARKFPVVTPDNERIGEMGARYLLDHGFNHFAYYVHSAHEPAEASLRARAFQQTILEHGHTFKLITPPGQKGAQINTHDTFMNWLKREILALPKPVAIMGAGVKHHISLVAVGADQVLYKV